MNTFLDLPVPASNSDGAAVDVSSMGAAKTLVVGGAFDATVNIQYATDAAGTDWATLATFHGPGHQAATVAAHWMRASTSAYKSGAPNADVGGAGFGSSFVQIPAPPLAGAGAPVSTVDLPGFKTVVVGGAFTGNIIIEGSEDGVSYFQIMTFYKGGGQSAAFYAAYVRARSSGGDGSAANIWLGAANDSGDNGWPVFAKTTTRIYARLAGSDLTGDGKTVATAYRTFQKAIRDVPMQIAPGHRYVVDITGIGVEALPANYALPAIQGPFGLDVSSAFPDADFPFSTVTSLDIIAVPQLATAVAPADQTITVADLIGPGITSDPDTNLVEIHTNKNYGLADSLKGLFLQGAFGTSGVIWHNTAGPNGIIYVSQSVALDEPVSQVFSLPVAPLSIVEPSAEFQTNKTPTDVIKGGFYVAGSGSLGIRGIRIRLNPIWTNPTGFDTEVFGSRTVFFEMCDLDGFGAFHSGGEITFIGSLVRDASFVSQLPINFLASMLWKIPGFATWAVPTTFKAIGFVADACTALGSKLDAFTPVGRGPMTDFHVRNGVIVGAVADYNYAQIADPANYPAPFFPYTLNANLATPGYGICFRGGHGIIDHVKIFGCEADGIHMEAGFGLVEMKSVTGGQGGLVFTDLADTPNVGYGLRVTDGAFVRVSDQMPVQGGTGDSLAFAAGIVTLTDAAGLFRQSMIGQDIVIAGSTTPANDGTFTILSVAAAPIPGNPGGTAVTFANGAGVTEAFPGTWSVPNPIVSNIAGSVADIYVGDPVPGGLTSAWGAFHIAKQLYDVTAVGAGGATGSGSRVFEKP